MAWFKKARKPIASSTAEKPSRVPEGLWIKCPGCTQLIYKKDLDESLNVCPKCGHHFRISAAERLRALFDDGRYTEHFPNLVSLDPLQFTDTKPYRQRLQHTIASTGLKDAIIVATGRLDGLAVVAAAMEYSFIGGSMGVVVGEKIARAIERADKVLGQGRVKYIHPDCGFWMLKRNMADGKIRALVAGRDLYEGRG